MKMPKRGEVYWVNLDPAIGSEIKKKRPALVVSNNTGNEYSQRIIVAPITSKAHAIYRFEVALELGGKAGKILLDQIRAIDKVRLGKKIASCDNDIMARVDDALRIALAL